jgi:hypothetical protein
MYSKPPQMGEDVNADWSVVVYFQTKNTLCRGQYNFVSCKWSLTPNYKKQELILDKDVELWWHHEEYDALCAQQMAGSSSCTLRNEKFHRNKE